MSRDARYIKMINSKRWRQLRAQKIAAQPICELCAQGGIYTPAREVHHITPVESAKTTSGMQRLMFDYSNLQSLCHECHVMVHRLMRSHSKKAIKERKIAAAQRFKDKFL